MVVGVDWEVACSMGRASAQTLGVLQVMVGVGWEVACGARRNFVQPLGAVVAAAVLQHFRTCLRQSLERTARLQVGLS